MELNKRFIEGYMHFQHEPRVQRLRESVLKYNRRVRDLGLRDHQVRSVKALLGQALIKTTFRSRERKGQAGKHWVCFCIEQGYYPCGPCSHCLV